MSILHTLIYVFIPSVAVVGLERRLYYFIEDVGVVEVCAIVYSPTIDCPINFPFDVNLLTRDNMAGMYLINFLMQNSGLSIFNVVDMYRVYMLFLLSVVLLFCLSQHLLK